MANAETALSGRQETETVADLVERYLEKHQPQTYRLAVRREAIRQGTRRWLVEVAVESNGVEIRAEDIADRIVGTNEELERDFPRYIRLMPFVPTRNELV